MLCIHLKNTNPFFCLAAEEYLLKNFTEDIFMLWQSDDTVVVGKHQNAMAEINYPFVRQNNITVARRISGGGTVFHDSGNVNFSFIKNVSSPAEISFKLFTAPVVEALDKLGVKATTSGRNDLLVDGLKVSGNAEHVFKNRVLHHGTLLFNSNLDTLGDAIRVKAGKYESKAVQSNRSHVANISSYLPKQMSIEKFISFLINVPAQKEGNRLYELRKDDIATISELASEKFITWDWCFGYSPKYTFRNEVEVDGRTVKVFLKVKKGIIENANLEGNYFREPFTTEISALLVGKRHFFDDVKSVLSTDNKALIYAFF
jgi:lipoate-protein ligase A